MRLWSLHPSYLDRAGLVALWREALLARAVLAGGTRGYRRHPQLARFRACADPNAAIEHYLAGVLSEAHTRGYVFDATKIRAGLPPLDPLEVTTGQLAFEWRHLMRKLETRDRERHARLRTVTQPHCHPLFVTREGPLEPWEKGAGPLR